MSLLFRLIAEETQKISHPDILNFAEYIKKQCKNPPLGLIFYGSQTKNLDKDGLIDFYLVLDRLEDFSQKIFASLGNKILPPNIYFLKYKDKRAKVAIISLSQLKQRTNLKSLDTTIWARFSQPVYLAWARDEQARFLLNQEIYRSVCTASLWSALLGPSRGSTKTYLKTIYFNTFKTEIRVEKPERITMLIERNLERYTKYFPLSWKEMGISFSKEENFSLNIEENLRQSFQQRWRIIRVWGKIQNILRLLKAGITFNGGADYLRWKVRRHTGIIVKVSLYERKYPRIELPMTALKIIFSFILKGKGSV
ncbi:hypothetical protein FAI41_00065 [Acetobacteraceae bacterium]|nr:hypothetical protein FAI41_00065 [Acetobacteraceae bacterium]